jgi:hypothetical protein
MEEFLENGIENSFSIKRGKVLACWGTISVSGEALFFRVHHVSEHLNFRRMSFSNSYVRVRRHAKKYREDKQQSRWFYWNRLSSEILQHFQVLIILTSSAHNPQTLSEAINPDWFQILACYSQHSDVKTTWKLSDLIFAEGNINTLFFMWVVTLLTVKSQAHLSQERLQRYRHPA